MHQHGSSHRDYVNGLFVQHSPRIRGFILSILPNMGRADDVLQETFLTVTAKADDFTRGTNFVSWACRIAQFKVLEDSKRNQKSNSTLSPEVIDAVCSSSREMLNATSMTQSAAVNDFQEEQLSALENCITTLAPHTRRAIELRYVRAHKTREIAEILGWSIDSVYVVLSRARDSLQKCINGKMGIESDG
tara:strand:- start:31532 stop:32101 length:570 start_codon:yes stop_codon:yes gene_type:complete